MEGVTVPTPKMVSCLGCDNHFVSPDPTRVRFCPRCRHAPERRPTGVECRVQYGNPYGKPKSRCEG